MPRRKHNVILSPLQKQRKQLKEASRGKRSSHNDPLITVKAKKGKGK